MMTLRSLLQRTLAALGRVRVSARLAMSADLDVTISNVSPLTPFRESTKSLSQFSSKFNLTNGQQG